MTVHNRQSARVSVPNLVKPADEGDHLVWKNDLMASKDFWLGWFTGLTNDFLSYRYPKVLMVSEKQRLDKEMMIAQMSGKFKLV